MGVSAPEASVSPSAPYARGSNEVLLSVPAASLGLSAPDVAELIAAERAFRVVLLAVIDGGTFRYYLPSDLAPAGSIQGFGTGETLFTVLLG